MSGGGRQTLNPATLAETAALEVFYGPEATTRNITDTERLESLDQAAIDLGIKDSRYWIEATRAVALPAELYFESDEEVSIVDFTKLSFEGIFACFARVRVGRIIGPSEVNPISALCLAFSSGTFVSTMENLDDNDILYVPVLAIDEIDPLPMAA